MKWLYRILIAVVCLALWVFLHFVSSEVESFARIAPYREAFPFPCFLESSDIYAWSLSSEEGSAVLLVQNIGDCALGELEIVFSSYENRLVFYCDMLQPGEACYIRERDGFDCVNPQNVVCTSVRADKSINK